MSGTIQSPSGCTLSNETAETGAENYQITYRTTSDWGDAFNAEISITNLTDQAMEGWSLSFDYDQEIKQVWNAKKSSESPDHYTLKNDGWNSVIKPDQTVKIGFEAKRTGNGEPKNYVLLSNQPESSKPDVELPKEDQDSIKETGEILKKVDQLLPELNSEDPAEIASKIKEIEGVKEVTQNGYYITITFDTGVTGELMISTEDSSRTRLRGAATEEVSAYGKRAGDGDTFYYPNEKIVTGMEATKQYSTDDNCGTSSNNSVLIWAPFHSEWEGNDEVGIAKTIADNTEKDVKLDVISDKAATAESLKKISNYGVVILSTHGHDGEWVLTGDLVPEQIKSADAKMLLDGQKRIVTRYDAKKNTAVSHFAVTDQWFTKQIKKELPGTVVINNSCESSKTDKLWNALQKKGAATYFGYSGNVRNEFAVLNVSAFLTRFLGSGNSVFQSYAFLDDRYYELSGSHFIAKGQGNLRFDFDAELKTVAPVSFPETERYMVEKPRISSRTANILPQIAALNLPADLNAALSSLVTTMLTPWTGDEVIAAAVAAYVCIQYWDVIRGMWLQICEVVGEAVGDLWDLVEEEMAKSQRSKENKKTLVGSFDIAFSLEDNKKETTPIVCRTKYK